MTKKTKVALVQLGSPKSPSIADVRSYLKEFLGDPRVVDLNPWAWKLILNLFVLPFRPKRSARLYSRIWDGENFPLITITKDFAEKVQSHLDSNVIEINHAFLLSSPRIKDVWASWEEDVREGRNPATELLAIAMFPQYSESTVASGMDAFAKVLKNKILIPPFRFLTDFHTSRAFIDNSVDLIAEKISEFQKEGSVDALIISFHGIPKRRVIEKEDPYYRHSFETFHLLRRFLVERGVMEFHQLQMTFQSRFDREEWLTPYTDEYAISLVESGKKRVAVYCPSFVADCLETIDEIGTELQEEVKPHGGEILFVPCLNTRPKWCEDFAKLVENTCSADRETRAQDYYQLTEEDYKLMPTPTYEETPPLSPKAKKSLGIVFLVLFIDLVGFSIIFPLFPALAEYYLQNDGDNFFLRAIFDSIHYFFGGGEARSLSLDMSSIVLFGGALGALYSLLQFLCAPLWGSLSDRYGRRPILLITLTGLALSYILWGFAGSFTILILGRFLGGVMSGNISTATAVVADVTTKENRSKGMATIGIAFALGFILGPAIGGIFSLINLEVIFPALSAYGINPFSMPAFVALTLTLLNIYLVKKYFVETLPSKSGGVVERESERVINPLKLFKPLPYPGINLTNMANFLFILAFSGMEFTLTFLAVERLSYSPLQNGLMFVFIGVLIALVQGGYVRRKAREVGEKKMALRGFVTLIPGLLIIAYAESSWSLYFGLFFLSVGSSFIIPCLTSLVSLYAPKENQGQAIGLYRSLGALGRVIGPLVAAVIYWHYNSAAPYLVGALALLIPLFLVSRLPILKEN